MTQAPEDGDLRQYSEKASSWLLKTAMPLWIEHGRDRAKGGFFDALDMQTARNAAQIKRSRVASRQIYVMCEGSRRSVPGSHQALLEGLDYLITRFRHPAGGYVTSCDLEGAWVDSCRDLYDMAFVLFALAHAYDVTKDTDLLREAQALVDFIARQLRHPAGGFAEAIPARLPRRQNPHMHFLEASLAALEFTGDDRFRGLCEELADLCIGSFLGPDANCLFEYFDETLSRPEVSDSGVIIEPGHHFEWAWLFSEYGRVLGDQPAVGRPLAKFAFRHGLDRDTGMLCGSLIESGGVAQRDCRLWPHAEWLKATLVTDAEAGSTGQAWRALERFLATPIEGMWFEYWDAQARQFRNTPVPATSLYHLTTAITALMKHCERE